MDVIGFISKYASRNKIAHSIRITKSLNLLQICTGVRVRCDIDIFKLTVRALSICIKVCASINTLLRCFLGKDKRYRLLWPGASQWRIYYHRMWGQL